MAATRDQSKVVTPFMPSLLHCASVKIAVMLFEEFDVETLEEAYTEIQYGNSTTSEGKITKSCRAKDILLEIPAHLRRRVMEAVHGSQRAVLFWMYRHSKLNLEKHNFHWRSDGSVDAVKTAQNLVQNAKFHVKTRFELSCEYCLEESVEALWAEMEASAESESYRTGQEGVVSFWVRWLQERPRVPWTQSLVRSLGTWMPRFPRIFEAHIPRCSAFFPLLPPEERQNCLRVLDRVWWDDLRFCLYTISKEEEDQMLLNKRTVFLWLRLHLMWPLQTLFLEIAELLWSDIDDDHFRHLLNTILSLNDAWKDFDYSDLFESFWSASPLHWREGAREAPYLRERIDSFFDEKRRKRKAIDNGHKVKEFSKKDCI